MEIKDAQKEFVKQFIETKGVFGVGYRKCDCCDGYYLTVAMDTTNPKLMSFIPEKFNGYTVIKETQTTPTKPQLGDKDLLNNKTGVDIKAIGDEFARMYVRKGSGVYGVVANDDKKHPTPFLKVYMDMNNKHLMKIIPETYYGFPVFKENAPLVGHSK